MPGRNKIYQAFVGELGEAFEEQTKNRIYWIMEQAKDARVILDVGCSQGITSILLGETGKRAVGIDIDQESIDFANSLLSEKAFKNNVAFTCTDFLGFEPSGSFDCIIMAEILEHIHEPEEFLKKAINLLEADGKLIVTVPFGINNDPDHCSTFYMTGIYSLVSSFFDVLDLVFLGRWIGLTACHKGKNHKSFKIDFSAILEEENNFLKIDMDFTKQIENLFRAKEKANKKYKEALEHYETAKKWVLNAKEKNNQLNSVCEQLRSEIKKKESSEAEYLKILTDCATEDHEEIKLLEELRSCLIKLETQNSYLIRENEEYRKKLSKITDTLIGRIGVRFYQSIHKIKNRYQKIFARMCL